MKNRVFQVEDPAPLLDYLRQKLPGEGRNKVKGLLSRGQVRINGRTETAFDAALSPGDRVELLAQAPVRYPMKVLYEDEKILAVEKPAGLLAVPTPTDRRSALTRLQAALEEHGSRVRLQALHRLDKDTSGVLVFTKDPALRERLQQNWSDAALLRRYTALVQGAPPREAGTVRTRFRENRAHQVYSGSEGREAVTRYRVLRRGEAWSLVEVELDTGRKNQIRVHMSELGCPVAGDRKYGGEAGPLGRLGLHADTLHLRLPDGQVLRLSAPAPRAFMEAAR